MSPRLLRSPARLASASLLRVQSDERLVELARAGHEAAFAAIVERYHPALERYAARLIGPSRGEDAVQQAFVNAHKALNGESDRTIELKPWLYRIVHNAALNSLRSTRDEQLLGDDAERLGLSDDVFERRERLREALDAVAALPEKQRDAILLRELEGRSHDEIAVALGMSSGAARQQIFRARAALRAAATAVTPWPLVVRLMDLSTGPASGGADIATGAGAGLTAVLAKAGAGVLVTGAVVGSAVGTGAVHAPGHHSHHHRQGIASISAAQSGRRVSTLVEGGRLAVLHERTGTAESHHRSSKGSSGEGSGHHRHGSSGRHGANGSSDSSGSSTSSSHSTLNTASGEHSGVLVSGSQTHHSGQSHSGSGQSGRHGSHSGHGGNSHGGHGGSSHGGHGGHGDGGGHHGSGEASHAAEPAEVEAGDVSNKPAQAGVGGKSGGTETTPAPAAGAPTTTTAAPAGPAPQGGGGGGGGGGGSTSGTVTQQALPGGKG